MPAWYYFTRPSNVTFHNLCDDQAAQKHYRSLLGLGMKFIPTPFYTTKDISRTMVRLYRDMKLKAYFANIPLDEDEEFDKKIYIPSEWDPKHWMVPVEVTYRFHKLRRELEALFLKRRGTSNLLPIQRKSLHALRQQHSTIVVDCDKNLGPCLIDRETYITRTLAHLQDRHTYLPLTQIQVRQEVSRVQNNIKD